jgi:acyl dehydratase
MKYAQVGETFGGEMQLTVEQIRNFAVSVGDFNPIHHDLEAARAAGFETLIASGPQPASIFMALTATYFSRQTAMLGLEFSLKFQKPVFPETSYQMQWTVVSVEWKEKLQGEIVQFEGRVTNLMGEAVLSGTGTALVRSKPTGS